MLRDVAGRPAVRVAAVVLAAGRSLRMAPRNKLLVEDADGVAMAARVVRACCASRVDEVVVVVGHEAGAVEAAVRALGDGVLGGRVRFVRAAGFADGMSVSLRAGVASLGGGIGAALVCLGDMPMVGAEAMDTVMGAWCPDAARLIVVPVHGGERGNPVLWDRRYFAEMAGLSGDVGARGLLRAHAADVVEVEVGGGVLVDFDTVGSLGGGGF